MRPTPFSSPATVHSRLPRRLPGPDTASMFNAERQHQLFAAFRDGKEYGME